MERYKVIIAPEARVDIRDIVRYISFELREPATAEKLALCLRDAAYSLETMPERYALVSDSYLASRGVRSVSVGHYTLFYIVERGEGQVNVSRVLYGKRDWIHILSKEF